MFGRVFVAFPAMHTRHKGYRAGAKKVALAFLPAHL